MQKSLGADGAPSPDKINNKTLLDSNKQLRTDLTEEIDYFYIPEELWNYFTKIYQVNQEQVCKPLAIFIHINNY